ncbi:MAG: LytTR family transcriptional regulator [Eubacterium sp.]|nr:LytTR family transcriptional regulator [Eubacterium sp.]
MRIKKCIDKRFSEIEIHVCNQEYNQQVKDLMKELDGVVNGVIHGTDSRGDKCVVELHNVLRFYAEGQRVIVQGITESYRVSEKLYELESKLDERQFIRISKSEIVNIRKIRKLDISHTGTIKVILEDGTETYTSRRNVSKLKEVLGIGQRGEKR